tara:strand:- start:16591 stop:16806 length:216 start_codon:yes stop_codon:yes gene_type:complete
MNANNNYARRTWEWFEDGRYLLSETYFDKDGNPAEYKGTGVHKINYVRDEQGRVVQSKKFNKSNTLMVGEK